MPSHTESTEKHRRVVQFLDRHGYDAVLLARTDNFAWFTCGGHSFVNLAAETGVGALLVTRDRRVLITNQIEHARLLEEELAGQEYATDISPWVADSLDQALLRLAPGQRVAADIALPGVTACPDEIARLRWSLTAEEVDRYRLLGRDVGAALTDTAMAVAPGMTEFEVAGLLAGQCWSRGIQPIVVLIAADDRLPRYRHPLPTSNPVRRAIMLVICGRRQGLIVSATRLVHFGPVPPELQRKHRAVVAVDAAFIAHTVPGRPVSEVFRAGLAAYAEQGFPEEWKLHHQGGPTGYAARDYRATDSTTDPVLPNQAFAWNPSITGTKSEDTIIATPDGPEIISASPGFPTLEVTAAGRTLRRPDILVR